MRMKSLKIPKGYTESVNRRTDNPMTERKRTTGHTHNDLQNTTQKTKDRVTRTPLKTGGEHRCSGRVGNSCSTNGACHIGFGRKNFCFANS